jgi:hypothetical protein
MTESAMILTRILNLAGTDESGEFGAALGVLLFMWALAAGLVLELLAAGFAADPAGLGGALHQLNDLLPADPWFWAQFTA